MKFFDIIYYQTYLFYSKKLKESNPHFTTTWGVGISFSFIVVFTITGIKDIFICTDISTPILFLFSILIYFLFYLYYTKNNKRERIVKEKPLIASSLIISKLITLFYFIIAITMMFVGPLLAEHFYNIHCR